MIRRTLGRYLRYWYTYRTAVAILVAFVVTALMYGLYTQQAACDAHLDSCYVNISVHPEDRLFTQFPPDSNIVVVGIDNASIEQLQEFPLPRNDYALVLRNLESAGAAVVAFDVGFPDKRDPITDHDFASALRTSSIPVVLSYAGDNTIPGNGDYLQQTSPKTNPAGVDQIPLKQFWCSDDSSEADKGPCQVPDKNVILASTDVVPDADGVVRKMPMFVEPACHSAGTCRIPMLSPLSFAAYRAFVLAPDAATGPSLRESGGKANFGSAWPQPLQVDGTGSALINYSIAPGLLTRTKQYLSFSDVYGGSFQADQVKGKIVLVGAYYLTGVHDEVLTPAASGTPMPGVELHANVLNMLLPAQPKFLTPESPELLFLIMLVLALTTAIGVSRVTVLWGLAGTVGALLLFTFAMSALSVFNGWVPDLFHPWLAVALTYSGVTAYRFLYEDREKRKVTALFSLFLKPEIVAELAKDRRGAESILRGGMRHDITVMFVDIRGFTSMAESMSAPDVTEVVQLFLDHQSNIIFDWDGTVDKYVGDEIVAFWNAPRLQGNHALLALRCAYDLVNRASDLQERLIAQGLPPIRWGIGINSGAAVVGNMGSRSRLQYTALGDTVNTAARFCAHAPAFQVLIGQQTYDMCQEYIAVDLVPGVQLKGKSAATFRIYDVTAIRERPDSTWVQFPTQVATDSHTSFTSQYAQQMVIAAGESGSTDILVGDAAKELMGGGQHP